MAKKYANKTWTMESGEVIINVLLRFKRLVGTIFPPEALLRRGGVSLEAAGPSRRPMLQGRYNSRPHALRQCMAASERLTKRADARSPRPATHGRIPAARSLISLAREAIKPSIGLITCALNRESLDPPGGPLQHTHTQERTCTYAAHARREYRRE